MTSEQPDALALLDIARETLLERVLPELGGDARYQCLMIANAMAMAMRELNQQTGSDACNPALGAEWFRQLYAHQDEDAGGIDADGGFATGDRIGDDGPERASLSLDARLARDLRNGEFGDEPHTRVCRLLRARVEAQLAISNPRRFTRVVAARPGGAPPHARALDHGVDAGASLRPGRGRKDATGPDSGAE